MTKPISPSMKRICKYCNEELPDDKTHYRKPDRPSHCYIRGRRLARPYRECTICKKQIFHPRKSYCEECAYKGDLKMRREARKRRLQKHDPRPAGVYIKSNV